MKGSLEESGGERKTTVEAETVGVDDKCGLDPRDFEEALPSKNK